MSEFNLVIAYNQYLNRIARRTIDTLITQPTTTTHTTTIFTTSPTLKWCNLDQYTFISKQLNSPKDIVVVANEHRISFQTAENFCRSICGRLYFPSSEKEYNEVLTIFDDDFFQYKNRGYIWLRLYYNQTDELWKDPDSKEFLSFNNFDEMQDSCLPYEERDAWAAVLDVLGSPFLSAPDRNTGHPCKRLRIMQL